MSAAPDTYRLSFRAIAPAMLALAVCLGGSVVLLAGAMRGGERQADDARIILSKAADLLASGLDRTLYDASRDVRLAALNRSIAQPDAPVESVRRALTEWRGLHPEYADILVADATGRIRATASGRSETGDVAGSAWFPRALAGPAIADTAEAARAGTELPRNVVVGAPLARAGAAATGVVAVQMGAGWAEEAERTARLALGEAARGIDFTVINASGQVVHHSGPVRPDAMETPRVEAVVQTTGHRDYAGLGWLVVARASLAIVVAPRPTPMILPLLLAAASAAALVGWLAAGRLGRDLRRIGEGLARPDGSIAPRRHAIAELGGLASMATEGAARAHSRERALRDTQSALARSRERVQAFKAMAGWSCWEVDLVDGRVTWSDATMQGGSATERATSLDELVERVHPDDRDLMRLAMQAALARPGGSQDVTLRTEGDFGGSAGRRLLMRVARVAGGSETGSRLHVLSREAGAEAFIDGTTATVASPLGAGPIDPAVERRKADIMRRLTDGIVHDFNNALTVITTSLTALKSRGTLSGREARLVDTALQGAERGAGLTGRVTALTRRETATLAETDIAPVLNDLVGFLRASVLPRATIGVTLAADLPPIQCSERHLEIALLNLVFDAKGGMPDDGAIAIVVEEARPHATALVKAPRSVRIVASLPADIGQGRGLATVRDLMQELGGLLEIEASPGSSIATLWFPAGIPRPSFVEPLAFDQQSLRILLVEGDGLVRATAAEALADLGHTVTQIGSGPQAMQTLASNRDFDVMIADYAMPGMTGLQLGAVIARTHPGIRVILSGPRGHLPANADMFRQIYKPFKVSDLADVLRPRAERQAQAA